MRVNGILLVSSSCGDCSAVLRSISWARCLPVVIADIKISINGNSLSTSVHYKPTDSHNYLLHSSSHPQHVKNAIPFSQFLRLRRLCSNDSDFNNKCEEMCQFFKKRGYPDSAITTGKHRAQEIDRNTALQSPQYEETNNHNSSIRCDEGLTLETSAFQIFHGGHSTFINSFDKINNSFLASLASVFTRKTRCAKNFHF